VSSLGPLIGVTAYAEPASWRVWRDVPAVLLPQAYVDRLTAAGARVLLVPPEHGYDEAAAADLVSRLDGLVIAGGADVEPSRYDAPLHPLAQAPRPDRDDTELALVRAGVDADLPLLGVCRGMQVMAVAGGGALEQHLPDLLGHDEHAPAPGEYGTHAVRTAQGSLLRDVLGERAAVPTYHHQGVTAHPGYEASAWTDDGVVEAMEAHGARWRVGVQWHPEMDDDLRLFAAFVAAARTTT